MSAPAPSARAPGLLIAPGVEVPPDAVIGGHVVVHAGVSLGAGCTIQDHAVLGKPAVVGPASSAPRDAPERPTEVGPGATVCAHAVVMAGASIGPGAIVGDQAFVRERTRVGAQSVVGRGSAIGRDSAIGERVRLQTNVWITDECLLEDDVFVGPGTVSMNDNTMGRLAPGQGLDGVTIRRAARVGGRVALLPGTEIGEEAFVAAGSVVTRDVPSRAVVMGAPAREVGQVPDSDLLPDRDG